MLCVGSSLEVYPVAGLPERDARRGRAARDRHAGRRRRWTTAPRCGSPATWSTELEALVAALDDSAARSGDDARRSRRRRARARAASRRPSARSTPRRRAVVEPALERGGGGRVDRGLRASRSSSSRSREVAARRARRRARRSAAASATRSCSAASRWRPRSRSARARSASSSQASAASRPDEQRREPLVGRAARRRGGAAPRAGQLAARVPPAVGDLLARAVARRGRRAPARGSTSRTHGSAVATRWAVQQRRSGRAIARRGLVLAVDARRASARASPRAANGRRRSPSPAWSATVAGGGCGAIARGPAAPAPPAAERAAARRLDRRARRRASLARVPAHDVAPVGGPERPGNSTGRSGRAALSPARRAGGRRARRLDVERVLRRRRRDGRVVDLAEAVDQLGPLAGLEDRAELAARASGSRRTAGGSRRGCGRRGRAATACCRCPGRSSAR